VVIVHRVIQTLLMVSLLILTMPLVLGRAVEELEVQAAEITEAMAVVMAV
jgi:hypothetical protein